MLVLSRRLNEKIVIPCIQTAVQVLSVKKGQVRLGIEAPPDVEVLREELKDRAVERISSGSDNRALPSKIRELNHLLRNRLNVAGLGFEVIRRHMRASRIAEAEAILAKIEEDFQLLQERIEDEAENIQPRRPSSSAKSPRALLVEDNANERELLATFLRTAGLDVDTAGDGADALDYLRTRGRPDVVLLDMGLPHCDGQTMVRKLRHDPAYADLKIFAVTGHSPDEYGLAVGPSGVDRWFRKPLDPVIFLRDLDIELHHSLSCR
jgi:carbon storage regulator CsrA